jgi:formyltetrahydrofolate deformylase
VAAPRARLLISCADRPGLVALITGFLAARGANIIDLAQHSTPPHAGGRFFMRIEYELAGSASAVDATLQAELAALAAAESLRWRLSDVATPKRMAILVSRPEHCLLDLLWRQRRGELHATLALVASNHDLHRADVESFGVPYHHVPVDPDARAESEAELLGLLRGSVDLVVLARYMQILSPEFLERVGVPVINIHHSFLPAFAGADPYRKAHDRGVKVIGATAHYVTEELDAGPIIEQDVARVTHADDPADLERLGSDLERTVLARAVRWHLEDRVLLDGTRTVVFG